MAIDTQAKADAREDIANLWRQVHGLRSKLHGELGVLALRIEDNERRAMKHRKVARRWVMAAVVVVCLWLGSSAVHHARAAQPPQRCRRAGASRSASQLVPANHPG
jgi:hypothetical protein